MSKAVSSQEELGESRKLVMGFVEYTQRILNEDMKEFFESHMHLFDQDESEITDGTGHTLEQYSAFQSYERKLENYIDDFASEKGFPSARACFESIQEALRIDKQAQENLMKDIQAQFAAMRKALMKRTTKIDNGDDDNADSKNDDDNDNVKSSSSSSSPSKSTDSSSGAKGGSSGSSSDIKGSDRDDVADSKVSDIDSSPSKAGGKNNNNDDDDGDKGGGNGSGSKGNDDDDEEDESPQPIRMPMFFNPLPLEKQLESILQLSEYSTFSAIMRNKVKQKRFATGLQNRIRRQADDILERKEQLSTGGRYLESNELFDWLRRRLVEMLPGNDHKHGIESFMDSKKWDLFVNRDRFENNEDKLEFKRLCSYTFGHIQRLGLIEDYLIVRKTATEIMNQVDSEDAYLPDLLVEYLRATHDLVDQAETKLYDILVAHKII